MSIYDRFPLILATVATCLATGCATSPPPTPRSDSISRAEYPSIVVTPDLTQKLAVADPVVIPSRDVEPFAVRVPVRSIVRYPLLLEYRLVFYTPDDEQLTRNPIWIPIEIPARTRRIISGNAISRQATRYELEIRER